jgi:polyisoprenoid-binding protein YceI
MSLTDAVAGPLAGTWNAGAAASTFAFGVRHSGVFWFRGVIPEVRATLVVGDGGAGPALEGAARVESISVREPEALRDSVLGEKFFDASDHPELVFRSTSVVLAGDGRAVVEGELTMRGVTVPVRAEGEWAGPAASALGDLAGLSLHAVVDRRAFGFDWQNPMPDGGPVVGWEVAIDVELMLIRHTPEDGGAAA